MPAPGRHLLDSLFHGRDAAAVSGALAGDARSFEGLVLRHQRRAHAVALAHGVPPASVDDVLQESFLEAFRSLPRLRDPRRFASWFLAIVRNAARRSHRGRSLRLERAPLDGVPAPADARDPLEAAELRDRLWRRVAELSPAVREAIFLYYHEGRSVREVARSLDVSRAAVKKRLQEGRDALRGRLWRELEDELCEMLPSARAWKRKARALVLLVTAAVPPSAANAGGVGATLAGGESVAPAPAATTAIFAGVALMTLKKLLLAAAAVVAVALVSVWALHTAGTPPATAPAAAPPPPAVTSAPAPRRSPPPAEDPAAPPPVPATAAGAVAAPQPPALVVRVAGVDGEPLDGAVLEASWSRRASRADGEEAFDTTRTELVEPAAPGEFVLAERGGERVFLSAGAPLHFPTNRETDVPEEGLAEPVVLELEYAGVAHFRLVAPLEGDRPVAGARVGYIYDPMRGVGGVRGFPPSDFEAREVTREEEITSDGDGRFSIEYAGGTLWVTADGYAPTAVALYRDARIDPSAQVAIPMYPPTTLAIAVDRADGAPVDRFSFTLARSERDLFLGRDDAGPAFRRRVSGHRVEHEVFTHVMLLASRPLVLEALAVGVRSGDLEARRSFPIDLGAVNELRVVLAPGRAVVAGRVVTRAGAPVVGAVVAALSEDDRGMVRDDGIRQTGDIATRTGADGGYELAFPASRRSAMLLVEHAEHPVHVGERIVLRAGERIEHDVVLPRPATVRVRLAERLAERAGVAVELSNENTDLDVVREATTGPGGGATFPRVPPGPWVLRWTEGSIIRRLPITVAEGREYDFVLGDIEDGVPRVQARGTLSRRGEPVGGIVLWLFGGVPGIELLGIATTDPDGAFAIDGVPVGRHALAVAFGQRLVDLPLRYVPVEVDAAGTPIHIDVTTSTLRGRVLAASGPLVATGIQAYTRQPIQGVERWASFHAAETGADGSFALEGVYQSPAIVVVEKKGYAPRRLRWAPDGTTESAIGDVVLEKAGGADGLSFRLVDAGTGAQVAGGLVNVAAVEDGLELPVAYLSRRTGEEPLETGPLAPGTYRAFVRPGEPVAQEYASELVEIAYEGGRREVEVRCRPAASVMLVLESDDGRAPRQATVEVRDRRGSAVPGWNGRPELAFSGTTMLAGLPLEEVTVRVSAPGWRTLEFPLRPQQGRVARITRRMEHVTR